MRSQLLQLTRTNEEFTDCRGSKALNTMFTFPSITCRSHGGAMIAEMWRDKTICTVPSICEGVWSSGHKLVHHQFMWRKSAGRHTNRVFCHGHPRFFYHFGCLFDWVPVHTLTSDLHCQPLLKNLHVQDQRGWFWSTVALWLGNSSQEKNFTWKSVPVLLEKSVWAPWPSTLPPWMDSWKFSTYCDGTCPSTCGMYQVAFKV